ncbi:MAG: phytochelatin synthase [Deltaproteobacteria bacterium]|nr:phytochelatin synthase [Deltaproteobacteria bacterium]MBW1962262.1 phytochelatin synthase [Deltaproteobacteria bacterium]MBW1995924.1 phytochelatin synthase [Deltaproteobacteria bacterium]MBW2151304.1 phytochelatin synthase [Deltaproteobacteria bacterium]
MNLRRALIHSYLFFPYVWHKLTRSGPFGRNRPEYVNDPVISDGNPLKAALARHHIKQFHESSCSVASVVTAINAIRKLQYPDMPPIGQEEILDTVRTAHWKERMSKTGYKGRRGLPLPVLGEVVEGSLAAYQITYRHVETVYASKDPAEAETIREVLRKRLYAFEKEGNCLIIAHFDQGAYVPALNIPHISPVGGFDPESGRVLILDVDPYQETAYWVTFDTFYAGLASNYNHVLRLFGYRCGGYVFIEFA